MNKVDEEYDPITGACLTCGEYHLSGECPLDDDVREREARAAEERAATTVFDADADTQTCAACGHTWPTGTEVHDMQTDTFYCPACGAEIQGA